MTSPCSLRLGATLFCTAAWIAGSWAYAGERHSAATRDQVRQILDATGVTGKLVVVVGCGDGTLVIRVPQTPPQQIATVIAVECEGDRLQLAPFKTAYDAGKKQIFMAAANFQAHASSVKTLSLYYDRDAKAIVNWRNNRGGGATAAWTYEVPEAGEYAVSLDYSLAKPHAGAPVAVLVNGQKRFEFKTTNSGGYDRYQKVAIGTVNLERGRQDFALAPVKSTDAKVLLMQLRGICLARK